MKKMKMTLSVLLSVLLMLSTIPMSIAAEDVTVVSVAVDNLSVIEYTDGQQISTAEGNTVIPLYWSYPVKPTITVTLSDGSSVTCDGKTGYYDLYIATGEWPQFDDDQSADNEWGVGDHIVPWTLGEFSGTYTVTVEETPVESIEVADGTVRQYVDGYWNGHRDDNDVWQANSWFTHYAYDNNADVTVHYKDGTTLTCTVAELFEKTGYSAKYKVQQSYGNELTLGEHTGTVRFMNTEASYAITLVDVIDRIEWETLPSKTAYLYSERLDLSGGVVRVHFTDGTYEDIPLGGDIYSSAYTVDALAGTFDADVAPTNFLTPGDATLSFAFLGETLTATVQVKAEPSSITLVSGDDHSLTMTFSYDDGSDDDTLEIRSLSLASGSSSSTGLHKYNGHIVTDRGLLRMNVQAHTVENTLSFSLSDGEGVSSNSINDLQWFHAFWRIDQSFMVQALDTYRLGVDHFNGTATADNIDALLCIAALGIKRIGFEPGTTGDTVEFSPNIASVIVEEEFGITIDATQSRFYDAQTNRLTIPKTYSSGSYSGMEYVIPTYKDGEWFVEVRRDKDNTFTLTLDDNMLITGFDFFTVGDVTNDDTVNMFDVQKLFIGVSGGSAADYNTVAADINADGKNNMADVMALYAQIAGRA